MKKLFLVLFGLGATAGTASAQVEIGLKVSPSVTSLRTESSTRAGLQDEGSKLTIGGGLVIDYFFGQNYAFSTGLLLTGKGGKISYYDGQSSTREEQKIGLQYLEVPLTVKLFTNDISNDTKLYFQLGGQLGGVIAARVNGEKYYTDPSNSIGETKASDHVIIPDVGVLLGAGVENQLGQSTKLFAGLSYHRGLLNIDKYLEDKHGYDGVALKNSEFMLDLGIKF